MATRVLTLRAQDWQLYNRVGATLANSGRPGEALDYYYRALELNPAYIRARCVPRSFLSPPAGQPWAQ